MLVAGGFRQHLIYAMEQIVRARQAQLKRGGIAAQFGRQLQRSGGDDDGASRGAEFIGEIAEAAADFVVVAVTREILEEKNCIALDFGDVRERLFWLICVVKRRAGNLREARGDAPGEERDAELDGDGQQEVRETVFLSGLDRDD